MKKLFFVLAFFAAAPVTFAQPHMIGHTTLTFNDSLRTGGFGSGGGAGRQIQSEIYYPSAVAGEDVPVAIGSHPVVVFGHGFVMSWDAYENVWQYLVAEGYVLVFPRTEGNFSPSHDEFALDLSQCATEMQAENADATSLFFGKIAPKTAIMGHSMGGGASFLAAANNTTIETVIGLAPAETNPSAIGAAVNVQVPALILSGSSDGVTPPVDHHIPIYNALTVNCKYFISITGGAHCYFANSNFNCDFGEGTASSGITVTRSEQQQIAEDYVLPWLDYYLKNDAAANTTFVNALPGDTRITYMDGCITNGLPNNALKNQIQMYPNPTTGDVQIDLGTEYTLSNLTVRDASGRILLEQTRNVKVAQIDLTSFQDGMYFIEVSTLRERVVLRLIKH